MTKFRRHLETPHRKDARHVASSAGIEVRVNSEGVGPGDSCFWRHTVEHMRQPSHDERPSRTLGMVGSR